eukprot:TRINITY_DN3742_c0_g1_i2.p1 TRINITY_DN3742_c0_g1~~TRINITY_DN3742_c0_g1_i2.p1  ORF type:complete len:791 (-),score=235.28 TRINITY_DN3742_c0_g1_i2:96-2468(-)
MSSGRPRRNSSRNSGRHIFDFMINKSNQSPKAKNRSSRGSSLHKDSSSAPSLLPGVEISVENNEENSLLSWDAIVHVGSFLGHNDMLSLDLLCREFSRRTNEMWRRRAEREGIANYKFLGFKHHLRSSKLNFVLAKRLLWFFCEIQSSFPCHGHQFDNGHLTCIAFTSQKSIRAYNGTIDISNNASLEERFSRFAKLQGRYNSHLNFFQNFDYLVNSNLQSLIPSNATCGLDVTSPIANSREIHSQILHNAINSKAEAGDALLALCMELMAGNSNNNSSFNVNNDNFTFLLAKSAVERGAHAAAIVYLRSRSSGLNGSHSKQIKNHMETLVISSATHNLNENNQKMTRKSKYAPVNLYIKLLVRIFSFAKAEKFLKKKWEPITQSLVKGGDMEAWSLMATPYVTLGKLLLSNSPTVKDQATCKELFEKAARLHNAKGQYRLALMLRKMSDETHTEDLGSARHWLSLAAGQGHHKSQRLLAWMLRSGEGGNTDLRSSRMWYQRAALSGDLLSLRAYAWMLYFGKGGYQDKSHATQLFRIAGLRGDGESAYRYAWSLVPGEDDLDPVSNEEATKIRMAFTKAATLGHKPAMSALGRILFTGEGGFVDMPSARHWFTAASDKGDTISKCNLGWMMIAGEGGPVDMDGGAKLLSKGPDPNGEQFNMSSVSRGTSPSMVKGKALPHRTGSVLTRLADEGFLPAQYSLIWMLTDPTNNERDLMKAKIQLLKAMAQTKRDQRYLLDLLPKEEDSESKEGDDNSKELTRSDSSLKKSNKVPKSPLVKSKSKSGRKNEK